MEIAVDDAVDEAADAESIGALLRPFVVDRTFVLVGAPAHRFSLEANLLLDFGARHVAIVGDGMGVVAPRPRDGLSWVVVEVRGRTYGEARFRAAARLGALPPHVLAHLDAVDPDRRAWVINANNAFTGAVVAGRRVLARSHRAWTALEDKTTSHLLWQAAGVQHSPFELVPARRDDLLDAARRLDRGAGTVWAGDARDILVGGAEMTRWVRDSVDEHATVTLLTRHCDRVRVMPFLEGVPCSIHGILTADGIAVLRPCEMIVVRDRSPGHFRFVGMGTGWDPAPHDREDMRDVARRVGAVLRDAHGYRGTFTVDGVMTIDGFRPTEVNPRLGAALALVSGAIPRAGLLLHTQFLAEGIDTGLRVADVDHHIVAAADAARALLVGDFFDLDAEPVERPIQIDNGLPRLTAAGDERDGVVRVVRANSYLRSAAVVELEPGRLPVGPSSAPLATAGLDLARASAGLHAEHLEAARSVR
jgi:ATP-grasp domain